MLENILLKPQTLHFPFNLMASLPLLHPLCCLSKELKYKKEDGRLVNLNPKLKGAKCNLIKQILPGVVCSIMNVFYTTCIHNFLPRNLRTFSSTNHKTEFGHSTMILSTSIQTHSCILCTAVRVSSFEVSTTHVSS